MLKGRGRGGEPFGRGGRAAREGEVARPVQGAGRSQSERASGEGRGKSAPRGDGTKVGVTGAPGLMDVKRGESSRRRASALHEAGGVSALCRRAERPVCEQRAASSEKLTRACRSSRAAGLRRACIVRRREQVSDAGHARRRADQR